jgi:hypothetical protein
MLKLKKAVNSFVLTKKKFKKRHMRGGMFGRSKTKEEKLLIALKTAIDNDYKNCLSVIDKVFKDIKKGTSNPSNIIFLYKKKIHIPVVIENLNAVKEKMGTFTPAQGPLSKLKEDITKFVDAKLIEMNSVKDEIDATLATSSPANSVQLSPMFTTEKISESSEIKKILELLVIEGGTIKDFQESQIAVKVKEAKDLYKAFLQEVSNAEKPQTGETRSMFSSGRTVTTPPVVIGEQSFKVTTSPDCTTTRCSATIQSGGSRKSKTKKVLKGGRRRR